MVPSARSCGWVSSPSLAALNSIKYRRHEDSITEKSLETRGGGKTFWLKYHEPCTVPPIRRNNVAVRLACGPLRPGGCGWFLGVVAQPWTTARTGSWKLASIALLQSCRRGCLGRRSWRRICDGRVARCVPWSPPQDASPGSRVSVAWPSFPLLYVSRTIHAA